MSIKIYLPRNIHNLANWLNVVEVDGNTVGDCLNDLVRQFPVIKNILFGNKGDLSSALEVFVNRKSAFPDELLKPVRNGDEIHIKLIIAGG